MPVVMPTIQAGLKELADNKIITLVGTAAPTSGTSGTGAGVAGPCSSYYDVNNKVAYVQSGTIASPLWKSVNVT